ncbi:hypothetical protein [Massilia sp. Bi118]|nr:hypothetical protein [Massilia sp. Bi118]
MRKLFDNALRYTPARGRVAFDPAPSEDGALPRFEDAAPGWIGA